MFRVCPFSLHTIISHYLAHNAFDQKTECKKMRLEVFFGILRQFLPRIDQLSVCTLHCTKPGVINSNPFISVSSYFHYDPPSFPLQSKTEFYFTSIAKGCYASLSVGKLSFTTTEFLLLLEIWMDTELYHPLALSSFWSCN